MNHNNFARYGVDQFRYFLSLLYSEMNCRIECTKFVAAVPCKIYSNMMYATAF